MSDDDAFLAAIIADPDNDMPRLVYADYLDEQGISERAEFIRVQCEQARSSERSHIYDDLAHQSWSEKYPDYRSWRVPNLHGAQRFRRGFVEWVDTTAESLLENADELFRHAPVRELRIRNAGGHWEKMAQLAGLSTIRHLDLTNSETFGNNRINNFLTQAPLDSLTSLTLCNNQLWPEMLEVLAENPVIARLTSLDLSGNPVQDRGAELLATDPNFAELKQLRLNSHAQRSEYCIHIDGVNALAQSRVLTQLERLELGGQYVGDTGFIALLNSGKTKLNCLMLNDAEIGQDGDEAFQRLAKQEYLRSMPNLKSFYLLGNRVSRLAALELAHAVGSMSGFRINLQLCDIDESTWTILNEAPHHGQILLDEEPPWI